MKDQKQQLADRYIRGEMTSEERLSFKKLLSEDEELLEIYKYTERVSRAVKDRNEKIDKINTWKGEERLKNKFHGTGMSKITYAVLGIAAVVAVFFLLNRCPEMPVLDTSSYECYRGSSCVYHVASLIKDGQYEKALNLIDKEEKVFKSEADSIKRLVPAATCASLVQLRYELSANSLDYDELRWLKVYAYIGLKKYDKARTLLKEISSVDGAYKEKADSVLQRL